MSDQVTQVLTKAIGVLGTTVGRDKIIKLVQYVSLYLSNSGSTKSSIEHFEKLNYNMWITRKFLRFGLLWHFIKEVKKLTDPSKDKNEQVGTMKNGKDGFKSLNSSSKEIEEGAEAKSHSDILSFDTPSLKALSVISNLLFCVADIPLFLKEVKILEWENTTFERVSRIKHLLWVFSCLFTLAKDYIRLKDVNRKVEHFKRMAFVDPKSLKDNDKDFDGKSFLV